MVTQGEWEWADYTVSTLVLPHLAKRLGLLGAVRGLRRYVALVLDEDHQVRLIEQRDDTRRVLPSRRRHGFWKKRSPCPHRD